VRLVLVTGAGASRKLGDPEPLPLMPDWSDRLCAALDERERGLAAAIHLTPGLSSEDFEQSLGELTRWQEMRGLNERFEGLGVAPFGEPVSKEVWNFVHLQGQRLDVVREVLHQSLYREFGSHRINVQAARSAYSGVLALPAVETMVAVTTNYDPSIEMGLEAAGKTPYAGFKAPYGQARRLSPDGMVDWDGSHSGRTPVIHLHGAVGWYRLEGDVVEHPADLPYNPTLGVPLVLYPDPDKDPTSDAVVEALWAEFDKALAGGTHVLVVGHSLHDPALVQRLSRLNAETHLAVCCHVDDDYFMTPPAHRRAPPEKLDRIKSLLPNASVIPCAFGPEPKFDAEPLERWVEGEPEPAVIAPPSITRD
jgi:hypothetical protein